MKRYLFVLLCLSVQQLFAQKPIFSTAKINTATLYLNSAELSHSATVSLKKGTNEIVLKNVANQLDNNSLRVSADKEVTILSATFSNQFYQEYELDPNSVLAKRVKDSIVLVDKLIKENSNQMTADQQTIQLLDNNQTLGGEKGFSVDELTKMVTYYHQKRLELANHIDALTRKQKELQLTSQRLKNQLTLTENETEKISNGKIVLQVMSDIAQTANFHFSYITNLASWIPTYEIEAAGIDQPLHLLTKGEISQTTGFDWKQVHLVLSSSQPNPSNTIPTFNPWILNFNRPIVYHKRTQMNIAMPAPAPTAKAEYAYVDGVQVKNRSKSAADFTEIAEQVLDVNYDVKLPYDIASNGKPHTVSLSQQNIPAKFQYFAAPKLSKEAYLTAMITDYSNYNLLAGEANIIFEGKYVGKTMINPISTEDTLRIALGVDKNVVISRKKVDEKSGNKFLSNTRESAFTYDISIRNNKKAPISIEVKDQFPISPDKEVVVELTDTSKADANTEDGTLTWKLNVKPQETKKIRFGYSVKYPKGRTIYNL